MRNLKYILWYFKKYKKQYFIGMLALIVTNVLTPFTSKMIGEFVDLIKNNQLNKDILYNFGIKFLLLIIFLYISNFIWNYYIFAYSFQSGRDSRRRIVSKILKQSPRFFYKNSTGSLMSKATQDVSSIETLTGYGILALTDSVILTTSVITMMGVTVSWKMTLISIIFLPLLILFTKSLGKKLYEGYMRIQKSYDGIYESVMENITSIRVIKGFSTQEVSQQRFDKSADILYENQMKQTMVDAIFTPVGRLIPALSFVIALIYGQYLMSKGEISLGQMTSFFLYLNMLVWPMYAIGDLINVIQEASSSLSRIQKIYNYKEDVVDRENAEDFSFNNSIEFKNFSFKYPEDKNYSLENINLIINKGETLGIVGKIGSGKTTLLKQLLRFYNVDSGIIEVDGKPIQHFSIKSVRDNIGYVSQQHLLFSKSVRDNIAFGKMNANNEEIDKAVEFSDFKKDLHTLPNGLETMIGEKGISISGGQKQRVSISRAIIKEPEILILDDSLSAVDAITEKNIIKNIVEKREGKTTIIVAHRLSGVMHADNIIVLDKGKIVEEGTHRQLLDNKKWYYQQYESQKTGGSDE